MVDSIPFYKHHPEPVLNQRKVVCSAVVGLIDQSFALGAARKI
jgi:hypothetical protein